jgi:hypothetical protein
MHPDATEILAEAPLEEEPRRLRERDAASGQAADARRQVDLAVDIRRCIALGLQFLRVPICGFPLKLDQAAGHQWLGLHLLLILVGFFALNRRLRQAHDPIGDTVRFLFVLIVRRADMELGLEAQVLAACRTAAAAGAAPLELKRDRQPFGAPARAPCPTGTFGPGNCRLRE